MTATERQPLFAGHPGRMLITLSVAALVINLGRQVLPPLLPEIIEDLAISPAAAGFALTVMWVVYALLQYPAGRVADTSSRRLTIVGGLLFIAVGFAILLLATTYYILILGTAIIGIGAAFFMIGERVLLSDLYIQRRGAAFGINTAVGKVGSILAAGLAVIVIAVATWQLAFLPLILLILLLAVVLHSMSRESYRFGTIDWEVRATVVRVFRTSHIRRILVVYTLVIFTWQGVTAFLPTFLQVERGFSPTMASAGFALLFAIGLIAQPIAGSISDRFGRLRVATGATTLSTGGLIGVVMFESLFPIMIAIAVFSIGLSAFSPVVQAHLMDVFPESSKGGDLGAFKTIYEGLAGLGPTYVGVVAGTASYGIAFFGMVGCLVVAATVLFVLLIFDR